MPDRATRWLTGLGAVAFVVAFAPALGFPFVWDDKTLIRDSALLATPGSLPEALRRDFWALSANPREAGMYRPVVTASYYLDRALFGPSPAGPHAVNLLLHAACALLLFALARRLEVPPAGAAATAALFALHPVTAEAVAMATSRTDLLAGAFLLAALVLARRAAGPAAWAGVAAAALLAALSKETALVALPLAALLEWAVPTGPRRRLVALALALGLPGLAALALRAAVLGAPVRLGGEGSPLVGAAATLRYLGLLVWPSTLVPYQEPTRPSWWALGALLAGGAAGAWALRSRGARLPLAGAGWVLLALAPVAGWLPVRVRFSGLLLYLPLMGAALALGPALGRTRPPLAAALLAALAAVTAVAVRPYGSEAALWAANVDATPTLAAPRLNLGNALAAGGRLPEAREAWAAAVALATDGGDGKSLSMALLALGNDARDQGRPEEAVARYREALAASSGRLWQASYNLALVLAARGELAEAAALVRAQAARTPVPPLAELERRLAGSAGADAGQGRWELPLPAGPAALAPGAGDSPRLEPSTSPAP